MHLKIESTKSQPFYLGFYRCGWNISGELGQYCGCWCPGSFCHQSISCHGIDHRYSINRLVASIRKNMNHLCCLSVAKWWKMQIYIYFSQKNSALTWLMSINSLRPSDTYRHQQTKASTRPSGNGLSPFQHQAIIWTNAGILLVGPLGTNFSEFLIGIQQFSSRKCTWKCHLRNGGHFASASVC